MRIFILVCVFYVFVILLNTCVFLLSVYRRPNFLKMRRQYILMTNDEIKRLRDRKKNQNATQKHKR